MKWPWRYKYTAKEIIEEIDALNEQGCLCDEAYSGRQLVDPSCVWHEEYDSGLYPSIKEALTTTKAQLAVAVEALKELRNQARPYGDQSQSMIVPIAFFEVANTALTKIKEMEG